MRRIHDPLTLDLFEVPVPRVPMPGALDAEIGKMERLKESASKRIKELKHAMGEMD